MQGHLRIKPAPQTRTEFDGGTFDLWPNKGFQPFVQKNAMGTKIVTEADRKRTPPPTPQPGLPHPPPLPGMPNPTGGRGQRVSLERGVATRSKKNPGKRSKKGG